MLRRLHWSRHAVLFDLFGTLRSNSDGTTRDGIGQEQRPIQRAKSCPFQAISAETTGDIYVRKCRFSSQHKCRFSSRGFYVTFWPLKGYF